MPDNSFPVLIYCYVAGDTTKVYFIEAGDYVLANNAAFQTWLVAGNTPSNVDTEANLGSALARQGSTRPVNVNILDGYQTGLASTVIIQAVFKVLFNHENRIRTIERALGLNGSPPNLTLQQALAAVKSLM